LLDQPTVGMPSGLVACSNVVAQLDRRRLSSPGIANARRLQPLPGPLTDPACRRRVKTGSGPLSRAQERGYASITPGRYLGKRHWISLGPGPGITERLIAAPFAP
jgi:hypothetical protein